MKKTKKKFRLITLLGIRPDYIRAFKLIKLLDEGQKKNNYHHLLVHSGQHYDKELFDIFLKELNIRKPDIDLKIGQTLKKQKKEGQAYQQSLMIEKVYAMLLKEKPDAVMFLGDTNTVLSSITVARCNIPVIHIEAGGRSYDWRMPEEKNRIVIDHLSDALYCYLDRYKDILVSEGIDDFRIKVVGNIIHDPISHYLREIEQRTILQSLKIHPKKYILITIHREENTVNKEILKQKLSNINTFAKEKKIPVVFPLMPRVDSLIQKYGLQNIINNDYWIVRKPFGFLDFTKLEKEARLIVTDSGTVQEDGLILGTPAVVARRSTERPETIRAGATILEGIEEKDSLYKKMQEAWSMKINWARNILNPQGGSPSERIYKDLIFKIKEGYFKKSRSFEKLGKKKFVKKAYNRKDI